MLKIIGVARAGTLVFPTPEERQRTEWLMRYSGKFVKEHLQLRTALRTNQQIKCHFGLLINSVIAQANDDGLDTSSFLKLLVKEDSPTGVGLTKDFLHELFYCVCPVYRDGQRITLSRMTIDEASRWFDECRNLLASRGIFVADPDPNWQREAP